MPASDGLILEREEGARSRMAKERQLGMRAKFFLTGDERRRRREGEEGVRDAGIRGSTSKVIGCRYLHAAGGGPWCCEMTRAGGLVSLLALGPNQVRKHAGAAKVPVPTVRRAWSSSQRSTRACPRAAPALPVDTLPGPRDASELISAEHFTLRTWPPLLNQADKAQAFLLLMY